jgi:hypothetical protein
MPEIKKMMVFIGEKILNVKCKILNSPPRNLGVKCKSGIGDMK